MDARRECIAYVAEYIADRIAPLTRPYERVVYRLMHCNEPLFWALYEGYRSDGPKFSTTAAMVFDRSHVRTCSHRLKLPLSEETGNPVPVDYVKIMANADQESIRMGFKINDPLSGDAVYPQEFEVAFRQAVPCESSVNSEWRRALYCAGPLCRDIEAIFYSAYETDAYSNAATRALAEFSGKDLQRVPEQPHVTLYEAIGAVALTGYLFDEVTMTLVPRYIAGYAGSIVSHTHLGYYDGTRYLSKVDITDSDISYFLGLQRVHVRHRAELMCKAINPPSMKECVEASSLEAQRMLNAVVDGYRSCLEDAGERIPTATRPPVKRAIVMSAYYRPRDPRAARLWSALLTYGFREEELPELLKEIYNSPIPADVLAGKLVRLGYGRDVAARLARNILDEVAVYSQ